jgi:hypothetical protein
LRGCSVCVPILQVSVCIGSSTDLKRLFTDCDDWVMVVVRCRVNVHEVKLRVVVDLPEEESNNAKDCEGDEQQLNHIGLRPLGKAACRLAASCPKDGWMLLLAGTPHITFEKRLIQGRRVLFLIVILI